MTKDEKKWQQKLSYQWAHFEPRNKLGYTSELCGGIMANFVDYIRAGADVKNMTVEDIYQLCLALEQNKAK